MTHKQWKNKLMILKTMLVYDYKPIANTLNVKQTIFNNLLIVATGSRLDWSTIGIRSRRIIL